MGLPGRALEAGDRGLACSTTRSAGSSCRATVRRDDAPLGVGSLQRFVDADFEQHYFTLLEDEANHPQLQRMCAFDLIANNTDRKGGHCLVDGDGHIWGIDNGLSFAIEFKLRTVIWDFAGEPIPDDAARRRVGSSSIAGFRRSSTTCSTPSSATRSRHGPRARARAALPDRSERPPLPLAAGLSRIREAGPAEQVRAPRGWDR